MCENELTNETSTPRNLTREISLLETVQYGIYDVVMPVIFLLGIIGNILNIMVFLKGRFRHTLDEVEKCAAAGLLALAISDLMFCTVGLPAPFLSRYAVNRHPESVLGIIALYYSTYRIPLVNIFLFSSSWLIVVISIERYLAVCFPFRARWRIRVWKTVVVNVIVFIVSVIFNIPGFLRYKIQRILCPNHYYFYFVMFSSFYQKKAFRETYRIMWFIFGTLVPFAIMAFCNSRLLIEIYRSRKLQTERQKARYCTSKITLILVSIVILYFLCVCPSTTLGFLVETVLRMGDTKTYLGYQIVLVIFNLTQAIYFSCNFALYCSVSRPFRDSVGLQLFCKRSTLRSTSEPKNVKEDYRLVIMR